MKLNEHGWELKKIHFLTSKHQLSSFYPIAGSYALIRCKQKVLIGFNIYRNQWELPAGQKEDGETSYECAVRELEEETGQVVSSLSLIGIAELHHLTDDQAKYNPIFSAEVSKLQPFVKNNEIARIKLWDRNSHLEAFDAVDKAILDQISYRI